MKKNTKTAPAPAPKTRTAAEVRRQAADPKLSATERKNLLALASILAMSASDDYRSECRGCE